MDTDKILDSVQDRLAATNWTMVIALAALGVVALLAVAHVLRRLGKTSAATVVTTLATVLGMAWSAQGMWDTAVNRYDQAVGVASVLFVVFEAFLTGRMLRAHEYRRDLIKRAKFVRAVWVGAVVMAVVVASGEGWAQAPMRLAIPLVVTYGWYTDLTADDDPDEKLKTSFRLTPRRIGLALRILEPGKKDAREIDRDHLRDQMTKLAFRFGRGNIKVSGFLRREIRLARMKTLADDADLAEVRARLARMSVDLMAPEPPVRKIAAGPKAELPVDVAPERPLPAGSLPPVQGVHSRMGRSMRGRELEADAVTVHRKSISEARPSGMTAAELTQLYVPPLSLRKAEDFAAKSRKAINGNTPHLVQVP